MSDVYRINVISGKNDSYSKHMEVARIPLIGEEVSLYGKPYKVKRVVLLDMAIQNSYVAADIYT